MEWPRLKILRHGEDNSAEASEMSKKERETGDRRRDGKITSMNGQECSLEIL